MVMTTDSLRTTDYGLGPNFLTRLSKLVVDDQPFAP